MVGLCVIIITEISPVLKSISEIKSRRDVVFKKIQAFWELESPGMLKLTEDTLNPANSDKRDSQKASIS